MEAPPEEAGSGPESNQLMWEQLVLEGAVPRAIESRQTAGKGDAAPVGQSGPPQRRPVVTSETPEKEVSILDSEGGGIGRKG